jgi:hypothetical protein
MREVPPAQQVKRPSSSPSAEAQAVQQLAAGAKISEKDAKELVRKWLEAGEPEGLKIALEGLNEREKDSNTGSRQSASGASS